jgi:hypothetical protein
MSLDNISNMHNFHIWLYCSSYKFYLHGVTIQALECYKILAVVTVYLMMCHSNNF